MTTLVVTWNSRVKSRMWKSQSLRGADISCQQLGQSELRKWHFSFKEVEGKRIITTQEILPHFYSQDWGIKKTGAIPVLMGAHEIINILTHTRRYWDSYTSCSLKNSVKVTVDFLNHFFFLLSLNNTPALELLFFNISHWLLVTDSLSR